jgi:ornithine carbamoyltransferase
MANTITFKPKQVTKRMLSGLPPRAHEVIVNRFGITDDAQRKTLEAIGQKYGITRERVRQIENSALSLIRKSDFFKNEKDVFEELKKLIKTVDVVYLDSWVDMEFFNDKGYEAVKNERITKMMPFQINSEILEGSKALVMHDMPIHTGFEITRDVVEKNIDLILRQAENRRHAQNGILVTLLS